MSYLDASCEALKHFENQVPWMYRDTRGNVTVAIGKLLPNLDAALLLPFQVADPGEYATPEQIRADWERIQACPFGQQYAAGFYKSESSVFLSQESMGKMLKYEVLRIAADLQRAFPKWSAFPDAAKLALLDMAYNLGVQGLLASFPRFIQSVQQQFWTGCALECHRIGISAMRNDWTEAQFMEAK